MSKFFALVVLLSAYSCVYDPPLGGKDIFIENQTDDYVFVIDSLNGSGYFAINDTLFVNNNIYISTSANYIPRFDRWQSFISNTKIGSLKGKDKLQVTYYFIKKETVFSYIERIRGDNLYDSITISLDEIEKNELNYITYYGDSIILSHEFSMSQRKTQ
jgi:hypothetical protein